MLMMIACFSLRLIYVCVDEVWEDSSFDWLQLSDVLGSTLKASRKPEIAE